MIKAVNNEIENIEQNIEKKLSVNPKDISLLFKLAVVVLAPPVADYYKIIATLQRILRIEENNVFAFLLLAYIQHYLLGGIDEMVLVKLKTLREDNKETSSMIQLAISWYYADKEDVSNQTSYLKQSINLCEKHVWNYIQLARLLRVQGMILESKKLTSRALKNIIKVYDLASCASIDLSSLDEFINGNVKGIYLTYVQFDYLIELHDKEPDNKSGSA